MELIKQLLSRHKKLSRLEQPLNFYQLSKIYDIFYICFDEPNRDFHWLQVSTLLPKARKIEGVKGFDRALKTCARLSRTPHFFVIDGDNQLLAQRFHSPIVIESLRDDWVLSWTSYNPLNGLRYGNGGLKLWPKKEALLMNSHESARPGVDTTDYCFLVDYYLIDDYVTETMITGSAEQAFRAGLREGVKMSLVWGKSVPLEKGYLKRSLGHNNLQRLKVWCEVGADVPNGLWAVLGARMGLKFNAIDRFECSSINSLSWIDSVFQKHIVKALGVDQAGPDGVRPINNQVMDFLYSLGDEIEAQLGLSLKLLSPEESQDFKQNFQNPRREGLLREKQPSPSRP